MQIEGRQPALRIGGRGHLEGRLARVIDRREMLEAVLDPAHGPLQPQRQPGDQEILGIELAPRAEAAADVGLGEAQDALGHLQHGGEHAAIGMRHLGGAEDLEQAAGLVIACQQAAGLQRHGGMALDGECIAHRRSGIVQRFIHLAEIETPMGREIAAGMKSGRIPAEALPSYRPRQAAAPSRSRPARRHPPPRRGRRDDHRDRLADVAHDLARQHMLQIRLQVAMGGNSAGDGRQVGRQIRGAHHRDHAF